MRFTKITIIKTRKERFDSLNQKLQWLGGSLGLFSLRDKDKSCFRIFVQLVKAMRRDEGLTSDKIASECSLSRGTVVYHIKKLMKAGIVERHDHKYYLRFDTLEEMVEAVREQVNKTFDNISDVAGDLDDQLGLNPEASETGYKKL